MIGLICMIGIVVSSASAFTFPAPGEDSLVAVTEFENRMQVFNAVTGDIVAKINLKGGTGGSTCNLEFNYRDNVIYYTDIRVNKVYSFNISDPNGTQQVILEGNVWSPEGLAYDWIHNNLYVCDWSRNGKIVVVNPSTKARMTLKNIKHVRDIEVDPRTGWLYYVAGWNEMARLIRCGLDGKNEESLTEIIHNPLGLSLDYQENKLYWSEVWDLNQIYKMDVNGENQETYYQGATRARSVTVSPDYVIFITRMDGDVKRRAKHNGTTNFRYRQIEDLDYRDRVDNTFMSVLVLDAGKQPEGESLCGENNGGCSHFCLASPVDLNLSMAFTCHCPDNMVLSEDSKTCTVDQQ